MVKHIVFFKINPQIADKQQAIDQIINTLKPLKDQLPQIKHYELGKNFSQRPTAFDVALIAQFDSVEQLNAYREHPLHRQAVDKIKPLISQTAVVDYEI